jgi:hypothetical protein
MKELSPHSFSRIKSRRRGLALITMRVKDIIAHTKATSISSSEHPWLDTTCLWKTLFAKNVRKLGPCPDMGISLVLNVQQLETMKYGLSSNP